MGESKTVVEFLHSSAELTGARIRKDVRAFFVAIYMLQVFKQADGRDRWLIISSSAFRDRDRETVSTKALEADVARADADRDYGPLRWWHVKGLDIGDCDFNAMHGRLLVESGTFRDPAFAEMVKQHAGKLGVSIGFLHAETEPDADGVFHHIWRKERSLLPRGKESNLLTFVSVVSKESTMTNEKVDTLKALVGDPAVVDGLIAGATEVEKAAEAAGLAFKETGEAPAAGASTGETAKGKKPAPAPDSEMEDEMSPDDAAEDAAEGEPPAPPAKKKAKRDTIGAMSMEEFAGRMGEAFKASLAAVVESQKATTAAVEKMATNFEALDARLKALEGEQPAVVRQAHVASQEGDIAGALKEALKETLKTKQQASSMDGLVDFMLGKK